MLTYCVNYIEWCEDSGPIIQPLRDRDSPKM
jgi:hypothetical protein